ncbi:hypothetical protein VNO77_43403 [Canavalia gladiata]|uniref:Uncharacterized protein n=1 Tax=Canavalia gladiata TaxID=3824 RepID=A0AAN9JX14_CANGL
MNQRITNEHVVCITELDKRVGWTLRKDVAWRSTKRVTTKEGVGGEEHMVYNLIEKEFGAVIDIPILGRL